MNIYIRLSICICIRKQTPKQIQKKQTYIDRGNLDRNTETRTNRSIRINIRTHKQTQTRTYKSAEDKSA